MKRTSFAVFFVIFFLAYAECALAQGTYTAATCNRSDVNAVINGPTHVAVNGDVIQIPAGTCTWTTGITVGSGIGITVSGSGTPNSTPSTTGPSASCTATVITDNISGGNVFQFQPTATSSLSRISCMKIRTDNSSVINAPFTAAGTCDSSTCPNLRIDNVTLDASLQGQVADSGSKILTDNMFGVLDHNSMSGSTGGPGMEFLSYNNSAWQGIGDFGDNSWASTDTFGTAKTMYIENNAFGANVVVTESEAQVPHGYEGGGRVAVRFNTCNGCIVGLSNHGTDSNGRPRGARQGEFYNNTFVCTNTGSGCQGVGVRSGVYIMFGNSLTAAAGAWFNEYMSLNAFRVNVIWASPWNQCNGSGPYDDNSVSPPVCIDQPGRRGGTLLSGSTPSPVGWVSEVIDPNYEWNDSGYTPVFGNVSSDYSGMIADRDWYTDNSNGTPHAQTSPTSPFNGTSGVGFGTLARRPTSCTSQVGYFATDQGNWNESGNSFGQGQLYVCTATNTWTLYYTPYTYPHPLVTGTLTGSNSPTPPTSLQAVVQ